MGKKIFLLLIQKLGIFWPIGNEEECNNRNGDCCEAFDNEDPKRSVSDEQLKTKLLHTISNLHIRQACSF